MKVAIVTGGNTGIGAAIAEEFSKNGYAVIINYLEQPKEAQEVWSKVQRNSEGILVKGDVTKKATATALKNALRKYGRLDALINNAGINLRKTPTTSKAQDWLKTYEINTVAPFFLAKEMLPFLRKTKGSIVNIASYRARKPSCKDIAYCASKAAMVNWTKSLAAHIAPVRVNSVSPGKADTRMQYKSHRETGIPLKRMAKPEEIAKTVLHVAENTYMTGSDVLVDGGISL